jgi:GNAT superfamily N-acetyltransferase
VSEPSLTISDAHDPEAEAEIGGGLQRFNEAQTGIRDSRPLTVVVRDAVTNRVLGGLTGRTSLGVLFIDLFFLPETLRGGGLGSRILRLAEGEGPRRGCRAAVLYTLSFQAPGFYERHGYRVLGAIDCNPPGTRRVFMTKSFDERSA